MKTVHWVVICAFCAAISSLLTLTLSRIAFETPVKHSYHSDALGVRGHTGLNPSPPPHSSEFGSSVLDKSDSIVGVGSRFAQRQNLTNLRKAAGDRHPRVLILTPVKDSAHHLKRFIPLLEKLSFPAHCISVGFLDSDSTDGTPPSDAEAGGADPPSLTWRTLVEAVPRLLQRFSRVTIARHDYGLRLSRQERHEMYSQLLRRHVMARGRNQLLHRALVDEDWVLWIDSDVQGWQPDLVQRLLSANRTIVVPNVVMEPGGRSYDLNSWAAKWMNSSRASPGHGVPSATKPGATWSLHAAAQEQLEQAKLEARGAMQPAAWGWAAQYYAPLVPLAQDSATACLSKLAPRELKLAMPWPFLSKYEPGCDAALGTPMIFKHLGGVSSVKKGGVHGGEGGSNGDPEALHPALLLEGYAKHPVVPLHKLRHVGGVVELGGVGGAVLLVWAGLHREGLVFPPFPYRARIETEGLAAMARDMGHRVWGMPHVEVIHT